jgi:hypothetical protein
MGCVRDELALSLERALQSLEHPVERAREHRYLPMARNGPGAG